MASAINNTTSIIIPLKVVVIGDRNTGNIFETLILQYIIIGISSFLKSLQNNKENDTFREDLKNHQQQQNISDEFYEIFVRDFKNNVQIVFQFTSDESYLNQAVCCILFYDITNALTFLKIKESMLDLAQAQMMPQNSFLYLVGNKLDLDQQSSASILMIEGAREVQFEEAQEFAQIKGILFNEVSSLKRKNIELVLKMLRTRTARLLSDCKDLHIILENNSIKKQQIQQQQEIYKNKNHENKNTLSQNDLVIHQIEENMYGQNEDEQDDYDQFEYRIISRDEKQKSGQQSSNLNTQQFASQIKQLDTAQELNNKEMSLSLNDINQNMLMNHDFNRKSDLDGINIGYGMDETDIIEDDKLLKSLEKRFRNYDEKNNQNFIESQQNEFNKFAIRTDQSPTLYKEDESSEQNAPGQTPQFQLPARFQNQQQNNKNGPSILDELQNAMKKYSDNKMVEDSFQEDRLIPYQISKNKKSNNQPENNMKIDQKTVKVKDNEFIKNLDNDIKRTEESLKEMNDRFEKIKFQQHNSQSPLRKSMNAISPIKKTGTNGFMNGNDIVRSSSSNDVVPIFEASLFKSFDQRIAGCVNPQNKNTTRQNQNTMANQSQILNYKSRNSNQTGLLTDRPTAKPSASFIVDHKEKPLITLRIKLSNVHTVSANIYKDDTAQTVADRVFRHANIKTNTQSKDKRKILAQIIELQVNQYINSFKDQIDKETKELKKQQKQLQQIEREKRLQEAASKSIQQMNTAKRYHVKEEKKQKVICKLSVIVGASKKGDIVAREGDNVQLLVKNFMQSYGLKRDLMPTIIQSLESLIKSNEQKKQNQNNQIEANGNFIDQSMSIDENELRLNDENHPLNNSFQPLNQSPEENVFGNPFADRKNHLLQQSSAMSTISKTKNGQGHLLFRLNFEIGEGRLGKISVREGDDFSQLAKQFVQKHNLGDEAVRKVLFLIEQTYNNNMKQNI
ncbi:UNKNOWN [Stylonychia lemnae]|uniref:Uncharacterized protein n=1 Tax=Stylonychia lemnae TaxID=5949 RepID=A0A078AWG4_STYLE|nr:UNKNOWN [Stylonychia lemnae]|eukprot:CDW86805.1 UNKNOWN [Stylonychia lemnae]